MRTCPVKSDKMTEYHTYTSLGFIWFMKGLGYAIAIIIGLIFGYLFFSNLMAIWFILGTIISYFIVNWLFKKQIDENSQDIIAIHDSVTDDGDRKYNRNVKKLFSHWSFPQKYFQKFDIIYNDIPYWIDDTTGKFVYIVKGINFKLKKMYCTWLSNLDPFTRHQLETIIDDLGEENLKLKLENRLQPQLVKIEALDLMVSFIDVLEASTTGENLEELRTMLVNNKLPFDMDVWIKPGEIENGKEA